jgi:hypothetical protein
VLADNGVANRAFAVCHVFHPDEVRPDGHNRSSAGGILRARRQDDLLAFRAESAHQIDNKAYDKKQANRAAADDRTSKVKSATAEQKKKNE